MWAWPEPRCCRRRAGGRHGPRCRRPGGAGESSAAAARRCAGPRPGQHEAGGHRCSRWPPAPAHRAVSSGVRNPSTEARASQGESTQSGRREGAGRSRAAPRTNGWTTERTPNVARPGATAVRSGPRPFRQLGAGFSPAPRGGGGGNRTRVLRRITRASPSAVCLASTRPHRSRRQVRCDGPSHCLVSRTRP